MQMILANSSPSAKHPSPLIDGTASQAHHDARSEIDPVPYHAIRARTIPSSLIVLEVDIFNSCSVQFKGEWQRAYLYANRCDE